MMVAPLVVLARDRPTHTKRRLLHSRKTRRSAFHNQRHLSPRTSSRNEFKVQELRCIYDSIYSVAPPHELRYGYCSVLNLHKKSSAGTFKTFSAVPSEPSRFVIAIP